MTEYQAIKFLLNSTLENGGTLGFSTEVTDETCKTYIDDLQKSLTSGIKFALLGVSDKNEPISFVVMSLNTTPNCRHIDLTYGLGGLI